MAYSLNSNFYHDQIITYMGNKRKILPHIQDILETVKIRLGKDKDKDKLSLGDGFSGSGIVSRLFKNHASFLYANDLAGYSKTLNNCYLANPCPATLASIEKLIVEANLYVDNLVLDPDIPKFIQRFWSPSDDNAIHEGERVYFTAINGKRIDAYQHFISNPNNVPVEFADFLRASLLVEASKHNNCSGNFAAFYKRDNIGHFGGKNDNDLKRITQPITLPLPIFAVNDCQVHVTQQDTNLWAKHISSELDLVYYDPPYNKHPYHIYYFLLDIINDWRTDIEIPDTFRGQPKTWKSSLYNSITKAKETFEDLIKNTRAKYILVSYNNEGIIAEKDMREILEKYGELEIKEIEHKTYNRMKGLANQGKDLSEQKIKESLYLLRVFHSHKKIDHFFKELS